MTRDPEPTPDDEAKHDSLSFDPANLAINTTRGEAMNALLQYALWIRRHIEKEADAEELIYRGLEDMPEVRDVLVAHLDPTSEPSLAIRSIYGHWFPWLVLLDDKWAKDHVELIFPADEKYSAPLAVTLLTA